MQCWCLQHLHAEHHDVPDGGEADGRHRQASPPQRRSIRRPGHARHRSHGSAFALARSVLEPSARLAVLSPLNTSRTPCPWSFVPRLAASSLEYAVAASFRSTPIARAVCFTKFIFEATSTLLEEVTRKVFDICSNFIPTVTASFASENAALPMPTRASMASIATACAWDRGWITAPPSAPPARLKRSASTPKAPSRPRNVLCACPDAHEIGRAHV